MTKDHNSTSRFANMEHFRMVAGNLRDLAQCIGTDCATNCAYNSNGQCGMVVLRSVMQRLAGAEEYTVQPSAENDASLIRFVDENPNKPRIEED